MNSVWVNELADDFPLALLMHVHLLIIRGAVPELLPEHIAKATGCRHEQIQSLLDRLADLEVVGRTTTLRCPRCDMLLSATDAKGLRCPSCEWSLLENDGPIPSKTIYVTRTPQSRDVDWIITIHGMNTHGAWQEEFAWRLALLYKYSAPVATYKYGLHRLSPFFSSRQQRLTQQFAQKIVSRYDSAREAGFSARPDIIAHSFGTWLLGHVLEQYPDLSVGRIILTGSILRPDFPWSRFIADGRVEAVLNHYGTNDSWAGIAKWCIPDSGPSGKTGFVDPGVINIAANDYGHSDFFLEQKLTENFSGLWSAFLTIPTTHLREALSLLYGPGTRDYLAMVQG